jgi:hypothetical protein
LLVLSAVAVLQESLKGSGSSKSTPASSCALHWHCTPLFYRAETQFTLDTAQGLDGLNWSVFWNRFSAIIEMFS